MSVRNFCLLISMNNPKRSVRDRKSSLFYEASTKHFYQRYLLCCNSECHLWQIPKSLWYWRGKLCWGEPPVRQARSSAGIIYEKVMAEFLNTNRRERGKAGAWIKNIFKTPRSRTTEYTQVKSLSKSSCLLVHPLILQKYTTQKRYKARQLRKK